MEGLDQGSGNSTRKAALIFTDWIDLEDQRIRTEKKETTTASILEVLNSDLTKIVEMEHLILAAFEEVDLTISQLRKIVEWEDKLKRCCALGCPACPFNYPIRQMNNYRRDQQLTPINRFMSAVLQLFPKNEAETRSTSMNPDLALYRVKTELQSFISGIR